MGFKSIALGATTLVLSTSVNSAVLSYGGYTHDTTTNIVTGNGLEWLQWDVTVGEHIGSIQSQLDTLEGGGWSVANNEQMAHLLNAFEFGITFDTDDGTGQIVDTGYTYPDTHAESDVLFTDMFGDTYEAGGFSSQGCNNNENCYKHSAATIGSPQSSFHNWIAVYDDSKFNGRENNGGAILESLSYIYAEVIDYSGVALVRTPSVVPVPAAVWLFGSGLLGLLGVARRQKRV